MKKILLGVAVTAMLAGTSHANSGAYVGFGLGKSFANAENKMSAEGGDADGNDVTLGLGKRKLKDKSGGIAGKFFGGYEFEFSGFSLMTEAGISLDNTEAKYDRPMVVSNAADESDAANSPSITSTSVKRKNTFSLGLGVKKNFAETFSVQAGLDLLYSRFEVKNKGTGEYQEPPYNDFSKKKSKLGVAPWAGLGWDLGMVQTGIRYQYSRYQTIKAAGKFVANDFGVSNKIKPEYHTVMFTVSKKF